MKKDVLKDWVQTTWKKHVLWTPQRYGDADCINMRIHKRYDESKQQNE